MSDETDNGRVGLLFSGQGSQRAGMGDRWRASESWGLVDTISAAAGHDIAELLLWADDDTLRRTDRAQIATFALEMVVLDHLRAGSDAPHTVAACAGHSLGEYAALVAAGAIDLESAARLVAARGAAMLAAAQQDPGTMVAVVGADAAAVTAAIEALQTDGARVWIANYNAPEQTVLAGDADGINLATLACGEFGRVLTLPVGGAFHSPLMASAEAPLSVALKATAFTDAAVAVVTNVDAAAHTAAAEWPGLLARQLTSPVRWTESVRTLVDQTGCDAFVEIGPGNTLSNLVKRIVKGVPVTNVNV